MSTVGPTVEIIFFTDPDYGPCRQMTEAVDHLKAEDLGFNVEQIDVWQNPDKVVDYDVMTVPTTIIQVDGEERVRLNGLRSRRALHRQIDRISGTEETSTYRTPLLSMSRRLSNSLL